jgi:hypothetical protein
VKRLLVIAALVLIAGYALFEARRIISGPELVIDSPIDGSATSTSLVTISGRVENISFLTINGHAAAANEEGRFVYRYSPPVGYTVATVLATDRFGRQTQKRVSFTLLTYCPVTL